MSAVEAEHTEAAGLRRVASVPLSHLSVELGHLYMEDFEAGPAALEAYFHRVAPWTGIAVDELVGAKRGRGRVSTCFLVDDYFTQVHPPGEVIPAVVAAAAKAGLSIDYLARESGCAEAEGIPLSRLVESRLVPDPPEGTNGSRPPVTETGWLCNGVRSPVSGLEAMQVDNGWKPPLQNAARNHSVFLDVELWNTAGGERKWSCAFLAAVWQLLRLGALRFHGEPVTAVAEPPAKWPTDWTDLPAVVRLKENATPFSAYRTLSVLTNRFLPTEHSVRTIIGQVEVDPAVLAQIGDRSGAEGFRLPAQIVDRINYVFLGGETVRT